MRLGGRLVREACEMLGWSRYDVQRRTALPLTDVDLLMGGTEAPDDTEADELILREAFHRAGLVLDASGVWGRLNGRP